MDLVFRCAELPGPGETRLGGAFETSPGGKGANQATAIARLGGRVELLGKVGADAYGDELVASLGQLRVGTKWLRRSASAPTGVAAVLVDDHGQNSIVVAPGANQELTAGELREARSVVKPKVVLAQLEVSMQAVVACVDSELFILNPAPATTLPEGLLRGVDVLTPNESETHSLTSLLPVDSATCSRACSILHEQGVRHVVLTLGEHGCYVSDGSTQRHFAPISVEPVDTTAAGDAFSGALAHFMATGRDLWNAAQLANVVAGLSTTVAGAQRSMPTLEVVSAFAPNLS